VQLSLILIGSRKLRLNPIGFVEFHLLKGPEAEDHTPLYCRWFRTVCGVSRMRRRGWSPSIVPKGDDQNVYLVVDDFSRNGRAWREADETVIPDLLEGQYKNLVRVVGFNTAEKWSQEFRQTSPTNCAGVAICNCATSRSSFRISSIGMRDDTTTCSYRFPCASREPMAFKGLREDL
jgi:hypothetical protein